MYLTQNAIENILGEDELMNVSGGSSAQTQEILDYICEHDHKGYMEICASGAPLNWILLRYLYDHGVPLVMFAPDDGGSNTYYFGDKDNAASAYSVSHEQLMDVIRDKI